tara:strand:+ start:958 stop:1200 length:243 start_codon:yes stop_codon:yes gene_type:complete
MGSIISVRDRKMKFKVDLSAKVEKKGNHFVAWCPAIGISSEGETKEKALKNLKKTVNVFVATCYEKGLFDKLIKKKNALK